MDEGAGGRGWEKLAPEERTKLRHQVKAPTRGAVGVEDDDAVDAASSEG
jgi:hypothetical protein